MQKLKDISFYGVLGYALAGANVWLQSSFLLKFLTENLIVVLIALMAINTTTRSVVMTKLREITDKTNADFTVTIEELRNSLIEQIWYIVIALIAAVLYGSALAKSVIPYPDVTLGGLL